MIKKIGKILVGVFVVYMMVNLISTPTMALMLPGPLDPSSGGGAPTPDVQPPASNNSFLQDVLKEPFIPDACTKRIVAGSKEASDVNTCGLTQAFQVLVNITKIILALTGSAALLMFVYGGTRWIISAGNQEGVTKGKDAMTAAVIGIAIIFSSWVIVNFAVLALTGKTDQADFTAIILGHNISQPPTGQK